VASTPDYRVVLGAAIRQQRKAAGLSQEILAEKSELHANYVGRVERGEEHISIAALRRVAKALRVRVRDLVNDI
jgi:transcriptional regulator with XRE-family HTH domain